MKKNTPELLFQIVLGCIYVLFMVICFYPFYYIFLYSLSDSQEVAKFGVILLPAGFTFHNYSEVFKLKGIFSAFMVSSLRTLIGTALTVFCTSLLAYTLTKRKMPCRLLIYRIVVVSMYLNAGLIPWYIVMLKLGLKNNMLIYILPYLVSAFLLILVKTYMEQIPAEIEESAVIDGAGYFMIFRKIILPLSLPILAAVAVFSAVSQWNSWFDNFFMVNDQHLMTLQLTLLNYLRESEALSAAAQSGGDLSNVKHIVMSSMSIRMTITMVVTIPIFLVYPMLQKYFVKGIMLGAVKG